MVKALDHVPGMRLVAYCLMPNHWHPVLWPRADDELSNFMHLSLSPGPLTLPIAWAKHVNEPHTAEEVEAICRSVERDQPYGHRSRKRSASPFASPEQLTWMIQWRRSGPLRHRPIDFQHRKKGGSHAE